MLEIETARAGSERAARRALLASATRFGKHAKAYGRFLFDPQGHPWPDADPSIVDWFIAATGSAMKMRARLGAQPPRPPGLVRLGLQRFLQDVHDHPHGFRDEQEARIVAAACGIRDAGTPKVARPAR